ncbi:MAG: RNA-binding protein [Candidatus Zixiibacteriota bacterium]
MNIYVGNLSFDATEDQLREMFEEFGEVSSANIITDRETGRARGFAFVEMSDESAGKSAIADLNGKEFDGRSLKVSEARPRENNRGGGGGGNRGGGGGRRNW